MNKFITKILSVSLGCASVLGAAQFMGFAAPVTEADVAADIQKSILSTYHGTALKKKIKAVQYDIKQNEKRIAKLEGEKFALESKISKKREKCIRLNAETDACPYYNCGQCIAIHNRVKRLKSDISFLKSKLGDKKYELSLAKQERERLDGVLAMLLQNKELGL